MDVAATLFYFLVLVFIFGLLKIKPQTNRDENIIRILLVCSGRTNNTQPCVAAILDYLLHKCE